ncbi:MAG: CHAT domain-containing protein [Bacteroidia bacterium]
MKGNSEAYFAEYTQSAYQLYRQLLEPLSENASIRKLIIVPDGLISYLPFDLLLTQAADKSSDYATLPYLMKDFQIRYAHSATLFAQPVQSEGGKGRLYAGIAPGISYRG